MKVESYPCYTGWKNDPTCTYRCRATEAWHEVSSWMRQNGVEFFMLSSGSNGYVFRVDSRHDWFTLRWT